MLNEIIVAVVSPFKKAGSLADSNGVLNVFLTPVCGKIPNTAMVVAGTVAVSAGLNIGQTLLIMVTEKEAVTLAGETTPRRQFNHTVLGPVAPSEILGLRKELGAAIVVDVLVAEAGEDDAAEGAAPVVNTSKLGKKAATKAATKA